MRRELAIKVDYLDATGRRLKQQRSSQRCRAPWAIDEDEQLEHAAVALTRASTAGRRDYRGNVYLSARGGFGQYLRRRPRLPGFTGR